MQTLANLDDKSNAGYKGYSTSISRSIPRLLISMKQITRISISCNSFSNTNFEFIEYPAHKINNVDSIYRTVLILLKGKNILLSFIDNTMN